MKTKRGENVREGFKIKTEEKEHQKVIQRLEKMKSLSKKN